MASARRVDRLAVWVAAFSAVACLFAIAALAVSYFAQASEIQTSARNSCQLFRVVILAATPPAKIAAAIRFIAATPLHNCDAYASNPVSVGQLEQRLEHKKAH